MISNCRFIENESPESNGGAVFISGNAAAPTFYNCSFYGDDANCGGAIFIAGYADAYLRSCTFYKNSAVTGGAVFVEVSDKNESNRKCPNGKKRNFSTLEIENSILWKNPPEEIASSSGECKIIVTFSDILGGWQGEGNIDEDPQFVGGSFGPFYLNQDLYPLSPCVDSGSDFSNSLLFPMYFNGEWRDVSLEELTTHRNGYSDRRIADMGYHYLRRLPPPSPTPTPTPTVPPVADEYYYVLPNFHSWQYFSHYQQTEISLQNPGNEPATAYLKYYNKAGTPLCSPTPISISSNGTYSKLLSSGSSPGQHGSIEISSDAQLFGHGRIIESHNGQGITSHMIQICKKSIADDDADSVYFGNDDWECNWGGGSNSYNTKIAIKNPHNETNIVTCRFYDDAGSYLPDYDMNTILEPHALCCLEQNEVEWGSYEIDAFKSIVGQTIYKSQNQQTNHLSTQSVMLIPDTYLTQNLVAPVIHLGDYPDPDPNSFAEEFLVIRNPGEDPVTIEINFYQADGMPLDPQPFSDPVTINPKTHFSFTTYDLFIPDTLLTADINVIGDGYIIGHQEMISYWDNGDLTLAACELDPMLSADETYYAPYCRSTTDECTWLVLRNLNESSPNLFNLTCYDTVGNEIPYEPEVDIIDPNGYVLVEFSNGNPADTFSVEIESDFPISGWMERIWTQTDDMDHWYDANLLQYKY